MRARTTLWLVLVLCSLTGLSNTARAQAPPTDPDLELGIRQVDEGNFEDGIKTLDRVAQRFKSSGSQPRQLSMAYLYLAIAHLQLSQEQAARAKFVEALRADQSLKLSEYEFPPKVVKAFEDARKDIQPIAVPVAPAPPRVPPAAFLEAVKLGDFATVRQTITADPSLVGSKDSSFGATPLHWAALKGHQAIVAFLLAHGADTEARNNAGETSLQVAERSKKPEIVKLLQPAAPPAGGTVFEAAKAGDLARVRELVDANHTLVNLKDTAFGATPLHWAALKGQLNIAVYLLEKGADANARNNAGETPLQVAERAKRTEVAARLRAGAKPSTAGIAELIDAVRAGNLDRVRELMGSSPALVRAADNQFGATALHWAALRGEVEIARFLLAQGADRQARNNDGETPLQVAERGGKTEVVKALKQ